MSFYEPSSAEALFINAGPFYHLCTKALEDAVFFEKDEERSLAVNHLAISVMSSNCRLLAYAIMSNHFHFVLEGYLAQVTDFWEHFRRLFGTYLQRHGRAGLLAGMMATPFPIDSLKQLRNTIAYVIRNGFAARSDIHVFADPWSTGYLYFNPLLRKDGISAASLKGRSLREFTRNRQNDVPDGRLFVRDGQAQPWSFVDYKRVEQFYESARQFIHSVLKNVEGQVEIALSLGESPCISDEEMVPLVFRLCRERFRSDGPSSLDLPSRKQLALWLKRDFCSGNKQIARMAKLPLSDVDAMFPLSKGSRT